ncbi:hypothetical protein CALCODRAFT_485946 [Calocera cornea HHB12733]|uniref:Uncharacterized protein n=1 Tax=Calocera cornea HHB12733 TaxID=1353952 RepID=A0A165E1W3_9BASI|nr:hypothetical protein CALCODRAFT_485946 [Calocera cornea HHB12733]
MAAPRPPQPTPTPPPQVFTNHAPQHGKPEPPPPPDHHQLIKQRRAVLRGFDKEGREVIGPDLDLDGRAQLVGRQSWNITYPTCDNVGNNVLSCYPPQGLTLVESDWTKFVWNLRQPQFIGAGTVDVYLFHADSNEMALSFPGLQNAAGQLGVQVDDTWWGPRGDNFIGSNITFPYYFVVVPGGTQLTGGESRLATFLAIQTATPATLISASSVSVTSVAAQATLSAASITSIESVSSVSLTSAALASSSVASLSSESLESIASFASALTTLSLLSVTNPSAFSSLSAESTQSAASLSSIVSVSESSVFSTQSTRTASRTANSTGNPLSTQTGDLQGASNDNGGTPAWAIAVPTVLGFLALVLLCALLYFAARYFRWRRSQITRRGSMGSQSPMMENMRGDPASKPPKPPSPILGGGGAEAAAGAAAGAAVGAAALSRDTSTATTRPGPNPLGEPVSPASMTHNPNIPLTAAPANLSRSGSGASPFSGVDAEIMARAFREALNKPVFPPAAEESSSGPNSQESGVPQADSAGASKDGHTTEEGGFARVGQIVQEEGGRVGRVGEQSVRVQGPPSGEG